MSQNEFKKLVVRLDPKDNVLVALTDLEKGKIVVFENESFEMQETIKAKHKFYMSDFQMGDEIFMYGVLVGKVQTNVSKGSLMTTDNLKHAADPFDYREVEYTWQMPDVSKYKNKTFNGFKRNDGRVGTANYWLFIPTVFCENRNLDVIKEALHNELGYSVSDKYTLYTHQLLGAYKNGLDITNVALDLVPTAKTNRIFKNVDGIKFLNHQGGCGGTRQDSATLSSLLASYANHPNVAGITLLSLGCQHLQVQDFKNDVIQQNPSFDKPLLIFEQQNAQSEEHLIAEAIQKEPLLDHLEKPISFLFSLNFYAILQLVQ